MEISAVNNSALYSVSDSSSTTEASAITSSAATSPTSSSPASTSDAASQEIEDTVEISNEGRNKAEALYTGKGDSSESAESSEESSATSKATTNTAAVVSEATTSEDSDETYDLTSYSKYELQQMLQDGSITSAQYNAEIERRETSSEN